MHDNAGNAAIVSDGDGVSPPAPRPSARMVTATAPPIEASVITTSATLATDFWARNNTISMMKPKNPAAAKGSPIGIFCECNS